MANNRKDILKNYECEGQMSIFDFIPDTEKEEIKAPEYIPPFFRYLRYGPHTLVEGVRKDTKNWLDKNGVPDSITWDKDSLPCANCTWFDGTNCCSGGHTNHYEYGYLICDGFYQSVVERKPSTVGEGFPHLMKKAPICEHSKHTCNKTELWKIAHTFDDITCPETCCRNCSVKSCGARCNGSEEPKPFMNEPEDPKEITDDYIKENPTCFYVYGHYLDKAAGWHKVPEKLPVFNTWQLIDVVLFGKKTGTAWMEHEKWEAKDWAFRSVDDRRNTESTTILAWKLSDK